MIHSDALTVPRSDARSAVSHTVKTVCRGLYVSYTSVAWLQCTGCMVPAVSFEVLSTLRLISLLHTSPGKVSRAVVQQFTKGDLVVLTLSPVIVWKFKRRFARLDPR